MTDKRTKKDMRREQTRQGLLEAAESLFAEHGIAAVSLRQIGEQAGSLNTSVVGYYFGTKESLVEAIYRYRLPEIEAWRAEFLADIDSRGLGMDLAALLKLIWLPWYRQTDKDGLHSYGRFLLSVDRAGLAGVRFALDPEYPAGAEAHRRLNALLEKAGVPNWSYRFSMQVNMILETLCYLDRNGISGEDASAIFDDALTMARAAILCRE